MAHDVFYPYAASLGATLIDAIGEQAIDPGVGEQVPELDGQVDPSVIFTSAVDPTVRISTQSVNKLLAAVGGGGLVLTAMAPATLYCQKAEAYGTRGGASKHLKLVISAGLALPLTLRAGVDGPATMEWQILGADNAGNHPFVFTPLQSLPADNLRATTQFSAGPVKLNNVALDGVQEINVDFGLALNVRRSGAAASAAPAHISIRRRLTRIRITTDDAAASAAFLNLTAIGGSTLFYLRKGSLAGRVAAGTAEHVKFTVAAGGIVARGISGAQQTGIIEIIPTFDGTNAALVIDTAAVIA